MVLLTKGVERHKLRSEESGEVGWGKDARNWVVVWGGCLGLSVWVHRRVCVCRVQCEKKAETKSWSPLVHLQFALFSKWWRAQGSCVRRGQFGSTRTSHGYWVYWVGLRGEVEKTKSSLGVSQSWVRAMDLRIGPEEMGSWERLLSEIN